VTGTFWLGACLFWSFLAVLVGGLTVNYRFEDPEFARHQTVQQSTFAFGNIVFVVCFGLWGGHNRSAQPNQPSFTRAFCFSLVVVWGYYYSTTGPSFKTVCQKVQQGFKGNFLFFRFSFWWFGAGAVTTVQQVLASKAVH